MYPFSIGVFLESFRTDIPTALKKARSVGAQGLQVYATDGDLAPENMTPAKIADFLDACKSQGLVVSALCGDMGQGFSDPNKNPHLIERSKRIVDLAKALGTDVVTTHIGVVPEDSGCSEYRIMQEACGELASYADSMQAHFAVETGPEPAARLKTFLDSLHSTGVSVNLDPANLVMCTGDDPVRAVETLRDYIVHTHAKDGRMLAGAPAGKLSSEEAALAARGQAYLELPLGKGDVDWPNYLAALNRIGYKGFLTIEREVGEDPERDVRMAADFLRSLIA